MTISSRTPEGSPNRCPVCEACIVIEPSKPFGDAPCPACGTLLWFVAFNETVRYFDPSDPIVRQVLADRLGIDPEVIRDGSVDSLDIVELVMALEEDDDGPR